MSHEAVETVVERVCYTSIVYVGEYASDHEVTDGKRLLDRTISSFRLRRRCTDAMLLDI